MHVVLWFCNSAINLRAEKRIEERQRIARNRCERPDVLITHGYRISFSKVTRKRRFNKNLVTGHPPMFGHSKFGIWSCEAIWLIMNLVYDVKSSFYLFRHVHEDLRLALFPFFFISTSKIRSRMLHKIYKLSSPTFTWSVINTLCLSVSRDAVNGGSGHWEICFWVIYQFLRMIIRRSSFYRR